MDKTVDENINQEMHFLCLSHDVKRAAQPFFESMMRHILHSFDAFNFSLKGDVLHFYQIKNSEMHFIFFNSF